MSLLNTIREDDELLNRWSDETTWGSLGIEEKITRLKEKQDEIIEKINKIGETKILVRE